MIRMTVPAVLVAALLFHGAAVSQESVPHPELAAGNRWTFRTTDAYTQAPKKTVRLVVRGVDGDRITIRHGDPAEEGGSRQTVNAQTLTPEGQGDRRNFEFPLQVGKTWKSSYSKGAQTKGMAYDEPHEDTARVVRWESVTVPAGTFRALRIEHDDVRMMHRKDGTFASHTNETYWYVPQVRWYVKHEVLSHTRKGGLSKHEIEELVDYKVD